MYLNLGFIVNIYGNIAVKHGWYVVYTNPNCEFIVHNALFAIGFDVYLPIAIVGKLTNFHKIPCFPRYLFVRKDCAKHYLLTKTRGVASLVAFGDKPILVADEIIAELKARCEHGSLNLLEKEHPIHVYQRGERVNIPDGPLAGLYATFDSMSNKQHANVLVALFNRARKIRLPLQSITPYDGTQYTYSV